MVREGNDLEKIKNYGEIIKNGDIGSREVVLNLIDQVLAEVDAGKRIRKLMKIEGDLLKVGTRSWNLSKFKNIYLIGAGKACNAMAEAVGEVLGDRLTKGIISIKISEESDDFKNTDVYVGGHPLPNEEGMAAALNMIELIDNADENDLFISVISGGSSSLLTCPVDGISLEDEIKGQTVLLNSGASILEINAVRRHISRTNGGRLAERIRLRGSELISLVVGDMVGSLPTVGRENPVEFFGTPIAPDKTTIKDARDTIVNYALEDLMPESIMKYLWSDEPQIETPKFFDEYVTHFKLDDVPDSCEAAVRIADKIGMNHIVLTTFIEGESKDAGIILASIAREIQANKRPIDPPCLLFCSGETTTRIEEEPKGIGGNGLELVMGFALGARHTKGACIASIDTEGTDGTTLFAGGITDSKTFDRLEAAGVNIYSALREHSTGDALMEIKDTIFTGNTGTNLCDFNVVYVPAVED